MADQVSTTLMVDSGVFAATSTTLPVESGMCSLPPPIGVTVFFRGTDSARDRVCGEVVYKSRAFVIDDDGDLGFSSFRTVKKGTNVPRDVHACGIRDPTGGRYGNVLRFMYNLPQHVHDLSNTWVTTSNNSASASFLFS